MPTIFLWLLLSVYGIGILWVLVLLYMTLMKFAGVIQIEKPRWLFSSVHRAMGVVLLSAAALVAFDIAIKASGLLR